MTFDELKKKIYINDYSNLLVENGDPVEVFSQTHGYCQKVSNYVLDENIDFSIKTTEKVKVYIENPYEANNLEITTTEVSGPIIEIQPRKPFEIKMYEVTFQLYDSTILQDRNVCTDYTKLSTTYGECIEELMRKKFITWLGCLPPWFPPNNSGQTHPLDLRLHPQIKIYLVCP